MDGKKKKEKLAIKAFKNFSTQLRCHTLIYIFPLWRAGDPCCGLVGQHQRKRPQERLGCVCVCVCMCQTDSPQEASHNNAVLVSSGPQLMKRTPPVTWHPGRSTVAHSYFPQTYVQYIGSKTDISDRQGDRNRKHAVVKNKGAMVSWTHIDC